MKIIIIIPAYNESGSILKVVNEIYNYNKKNNTEFDIIVINDCSTDNTLDVCLENKIPVISLVHNMGIGGSVQTGYKYASMNDYDIAIQFDGDGQHDVNYISAIIQPLINQEADLVIGSRFLDKTASQFKSSFARRIGIRIISSVTKLVTGQRIYDVTSGFRAVNKQIMQDFANYYPVEFPESITNCELLMKKYNVKEVPVSMNERQTGISSIKSWKSVYFMINVILAILVVGLRRYKRVR